MKLTKACEAPEGTAATLEMVKDALETYAPDFMHGIGKAEYLDALEAALARIAELEAALRGVIGEETIAVHVGYDSAAGGGNFVYADAVRVDSDAFVAARAALAKR